MLSIIYTHPNHDILDRYIDSQLLNKNIITIENKDRSIKIKEVRKTIQELTTIPQSTRYLWIKQAEKLTIPAQNSLLKLLEEPPTKTKIILSVNNPSMLIDTIRSRCIIKRVGENTSKSESDNLDLIKEALSANDAKRISLAGTLGKDRLSAITWIHDSILSVHEKLPLIDSRQSLNIMKSILSQLLSTQKYLESNCNVTLCLENMFLNLPKAK